ncbi:hypothetical protein M9H77_23772 [Catharanthus roseus]|uniref:Uncharacterized protein n=1 Tax=Catharanthus roseus TaxID=4058 RepID=A0ACC0AU76_CATRO|nr:hypothetical protein M9H77_23772 [Catharanthus roseus]
MSINKISKRAPLKMISQLKILVNSRVCFEKPSALYGPPCVMSLRIQCFHNSRHLRNQNIKGSEIGECQSSIAFSVNRVSRVARIDAQAALFDYLHSTRGFTYTDAEHMSKNCPHFLQNLVSTVEIDRDQDVSKALSKFFRFHPINEFEPFLESLGLSPSELPALLPRDWIFLNDDPLLLNNFRALCDYGIPRIQIGKIYKEAPSVFRYQHGLLSMKLKAYENLSLTRHTIIKLVTCSPLLLVGDVNKDLVGVLDKLKAVGYESDWIGGYLLSKRAYNWTRMHDTLVFLEQVGYDGIQMGDLIRRYPELIFEASGKQMYALIGRLLKLGLKMKEVYSLFRRFPEILDPKSVKNLCNALYFLFEIGMEGEYVAKIVNNHFQLLGLHTLKGPRTVLRNFNGDRQRLCEVIKENPVNLFILGSKSAIGVAEQNVSQSPGKLMEKTTFLLQMGYMENSDEMTKALKKFRGRGDQLQERFDCLVQAGLDYNVVADMIKQAPTVLNQSKEVLEKKISFLKSSGYPIESIVTFPAYLCYDMERIHRRISMYLWLREKGLAKPMVSVSTLLACADARFMKYFVYIHPGGPAMWEHLRKSLLLS